MQVYPLVVHPAHPPAQVTAVEARIDASDPHWLLLRWRIEGAGGLVVPPPAGKHRADELWRTTCFELFLKPEGGEKYVEFNLSPSERWNAYEFDGYRDGMREYPLSRNPVCTMRPGSRFAIFDASIPRSGLPDVQCALGLSAVIEEEGGAKGYWAIAHADGARPDFHDPACFAAAFPPPSAP